MLDEDDFLYGGSAPQEQKALKPTPDLAQGPATQPDTQKIIANPAFTALLKSIGLNDLNMAERVKVIILFTSSYISAVQLVVQAKNSEKYPL